MFTRDLFTLRIVKIAIIFIIAFSYFFIFNLSFVHAQGADDMLWNGEAGRVPADTGLGNQQPTSILANIMNIILGFVGFIAVIIIIFGGFKWMTAAGNNDQVDEAKKIIMAGIIGLIIIIAAFSISAFVINQTWNITAGN